MATVQDVIGYPVHKGLNQQWTLEDAGDDFFRIKNTFGRYLCIDGDAEKGTRVIGSGHQQTWKITPDDHHPNEPGYIRILYPGTNLYLDVEGGRPAPETPIVLWEDSEDRGWFFPSIMPFTAGSTYVFVNVRAGTAADLSMQNYKWTLGYAGGFFHIKNGTGKYLCIDGYARNGARVIVSDHQQTWKITADDHDPSHMRIIYPGTNLYLDLAGGSVPYTPVLLCEKTGGKNQAWSFQSP
ncbi:carbohydrate-binding module family 13 protein [Hydnum rufescens UP504]|uniref:Carbohydrate-binding module family 13 protein n=1 Tax=Hydnum rufescens UP504 TaxID=1448309 RepID=A0A9P6ASD8_9AGAM|nr:carbohydrate-binding module family 13 protein [Hydnum rufescens UP504]